MYFYLYSQPLLCEDKHKQRVYYIIWQKPKKNKGVKKNEHANSCRYYKY